jgi:hypothetical protein
MTARSTPVAGASVAYYNGEAMHVMEPCACGLFCDAVMVASVEGVRPLKPWPLQGRWLENPTPTARALIEIARNR